MRRLFLIGNGYDISRRGDTSYACFKKWLEKTYNPYQYLRECGILDKNGLIDLTNFGMSSLSQNMIKEILGPNLENTETEIWLDKNEKIRKCLAGFLLIKSMELLDDIEWNKLENNLPKLPIGKLLKKYITQSSNNGYTFGSPVNKPTDCLTSLYPEIESLFCEWIKSLPQKEIKKQYFENEIIQNINKDDIFIIFNYTDTIEQLFDCKLNVFYHIHGSVKEDKKIVFGHNCKRKSKQTNLDNKEDYINEFYCNLYKNPEKIIEKNNTLWEVISNANNFDVYEYGWSCSNVDEDYIKKLIELFKNKNVRLHLNNFNKSGEKEKKPQWVKYGFPEDSISFYDENDL